MSNAALIEKLEDIQKKVVNPRTANEGLQDAQSIALLLTDDNVKQAADEDPNPLLSGISLEVESRAWRPRVTRKRLEEFERLHTEAIEFAKEKNRKVFNTATALVALTAGMLITGGASIGALAGLAIQIGKMIAALRADSNDGDVSDDDVKAEGIKVHDLATKDMPAKKLPASPDDREIEEMKTAGVPRG